MKIEKLIDHAKMNIPFYQKDQYKDYDSIEQFPIITKYMIREDYGSFISNELGEDKAKLVDLLETKTLSTKGWYNEIGAVKNIVVEETSGTTGVPFLCAKSEAERARLGIVLWKERQRRDPLVNGDNYYQFSHIGRNMINPNAYDYEINHLLELYATIREKKMRWIHGTPNAIMNHIRVFRENNIHLVMPDLKFIECTGTYLSREAKETIESFFEVTVLDLYGSIETWPIALTCSEGKMHLIEKNVYFELVDEEGKVIHKNGVTGRVVATSLVNQVFPLIRYAMGDYAAYVDDGQCSCGCKGRIIQLFEGRENNIIKGLTKVKFGNKEFARMLATVKLRYPKLDLRYVKILQYSEKDFEVWINDFDNVEQFVDSLKNLMQTEFEKQLSVSVKRMSPAQIDERKYDKPNIFICKC